MTCSLWYRKRLPAGRRNGPRGSLFDVSSFAKIQSSGRDTSNAETEIDFWHSDITLRYSDKLHVELAAHVVGIDIKRVRTSPADRSVLKKLGLRCTDDLGETIMDRLKPYLPEPEPSAILKQTDSPHTSAAADFYRIRICAKSAQLAFSLIFQEGIFVRHRKFHARSAMDAPPVSERWGALQDSDICLQTRPGKSVLAVADFLGLGIGDVVVLDRAVTDKIDILVNDGTEVEKSGFLNREQDEFQLTLA